MAVAARGTTLIKGFVLVVPDRNDDDSDLDLSDDDNNWPDFGEISAIASGGSYVGYRRPNKVKVTMKNVDHPYKQYQCEGYLHLIQPWWLITATGRFKRKVCYITGYPSYQLRTDEFIAVHKIVTQFLNTAGVIGNTGKIEPCVTSMLTYWEQNNLVDNVTFQNLETMMDSYIKQDEDARRQLYTVIWKSAIGSTVRFAGFYPKLFKMLSMLLPCHFLKFAESSSRMTATVLQSLEEATVTCPWVFGFKQIMFREYGVMGMEALLRYWVSSGLITGLPSVQKDALYIYNALKLHAKKRGDTYITESELRGRSSNLLEQHVVQNWAAALDFLDANTVIVRETEAGHVKVFLKSIWSAERDTAGAFSAILANGVRHSRVEWHVDMKSEDFDEVRTDSDQWKAVHLMLNSPISVLSGKGGCGKTSVVTKLLAHACNQSGVAEEKKIESTPEKTPRKVADFNSTTINATMPESEAMTKDGNQDESETSLSNTNLGKTILMTAPTGKAASLLGRKAQLKSCTLHSVIMSFKMYCISKNNKKREREANGMKEGGDDAESKWTHAEKEVLVVDECSLVSVQTFSTVVNILLEECHIKKVILLGDVRQLPSIEPGNFLGDVFHVFSPIGFSIELRTNHRAESDLIVRNATLISEQQYPHFDSGHRFHLLEPKEEDQQGRDDMVKSLLAKAADIQDQVNSQFVAFTRKDCEAINELCCRHYNKHTLKTSKGKWDFCIGDKVCMTKNGQIGHHIKAKIRKKETANESIAENSRSSERNESRKTPAKRNLYQELDGVAASQNGRRSSRRQNQMDSSDVLQLLDVDDYAAFDNDDNDDVRSHEGRGNDFTGLKSRSGSAAVCAVGRDCGAAVPEFDSEMSASSQQDSGALDDLIDAAHDDATETGHILDFLSQSSQPASQIDRLSLRDQPRGTPGKQVEVSLAVPPKPDHEVEDEDEITAATPAIDISRTEVKLCNGEIFYIQKDFTIIDNRGKIRRYLSLSNGDDDFPRRVCVEYREVMRNCKMRHAWVRTIHTFQGSEAQSVVYILSHIPYENWQHVYTAVTRGRRSVYVVGHSGTLRTIVKRWVRPRQTSLEVKLLGSLRPQEEIIQNCVKEIASSLRHVDKEPAKDRSDQEPAKDRPDQEPYKDRPDQEPANDNPVSPLGGDKSMFDSDDSWMCNVDSFDIDSFMSSSYSKLEDVSCAVPTNEDRNNLSPEPQPLTSEVQSTNVKRRRSKEETHLYMSPPKVRKSDVVAVTPVRSSLGALSLCNASPEDKT